jgi:hypothetical protein
VAGAVFRLRKQIRGGKARVGGIIREHEHFTRAGQEIDGHAAKQQAFRGDDIGVPGAEKLAHGFDDARAQCHGRDRLRAADAINLGGPGRADGE